VKPQYDHFIGRNNSGGLLFTNDLKDTSVDTNETALYDKNGNLLSKNFGSGEVYVYHRTGYGVSALMSQQNEAMSIGDTSAKNGAFVFGKEENGAVKYGVMSAEGKITVPADNENIYPFLGATLTTFTKGNNEETKTGVIDENGQVIVEAKYFDVKILNSDTFAVQEKSNEAYKIIDSKGNELTKDTFQSLFLTNHPDIYAFQNNEGNWGILDKDLKVTVKPSAQYKNYPYVTQDGKSFIISSSKDDKNEIIVYSMDGKKLYEQSGYSYTDSSNGFLLINKLNAKTGVNDFILLDKNFKELKRFSGDVHFVPNTKIIATADTKQNYSLYEIPSMKKIWTSKHSFIYGEGCILTEAKEKEGHPVYQVLLDKTQKVISDNAVYAADMGDFILVEEENGNLQVVNKNDGKILREGHVDFSFGK
jgi:hypothetical protein